MHSRPGLCALLRLTWACGNILRVLEGQLSLLQCCDSGGSPLSGLLTGLRESPCMVHEPREHVLQGCASPACLQPGPDSCVLAHVGPGPEFMQRDACAQACKVCVARRLRQGRRRIWQTACCTCSRRTISLCTSPLPCLGCACLRSAPVSGLPSLNDCIVELAAPAPAASVTPALPLPPSLQLNAMHGSQAMHSQHIRLVLL